MGTPMNNSGLQRSMLQSRSSPNSSLGSAVRGNLFGGSCQSHSVSGRARVHNNEAFEASPGNNTIRERSRSPRSPPERREANVGRKSKNEKKKEKKKEATRRKLELKAKGVEKVQSRTSQQSEEDSSSSDEDTSSTRRLWQTEKDKKSKGSSSTMDTSSGWNHTVPGTQHNLTNEGD
ncbi:hypothetical protein R1sor_020822 [Riccia sorocarpa]|uniref:Uncharacterized protein n=1 Tax=Riccia sorocarpa TaxID=122646 RepID=A0ABD3GGY8_9MARC